ncbi:MAG: DUF3857 and transglutaminase domain-containing protein [Neptuniibacter sp.]
MSKKLVARFVLLITSLWVFSVNASEEAELADISARSLKYHIDIYVNEDQTKSTRVRYTTQILDERSLQQIKVKKLSFSTSIEMLDIHSAYTEKADGRRVDVPPNNYQKKVNSGLKGNGPVFSDRTSLSVVFPDIQVGDSVVMDYTIKTKEPMFPGHFTAMNSFNPAVAYDDVQVTLNVPDSLKAKYKMRLMAEEITTQEQRIIYTWRYQNPKPLKNTRTDYSVWDMESNPGFIFSTFNSWQDVVDAYAARAVPKAKVTETISALAKSIVGKETNKREKARLLYEWVGKNITYAGNCIGVGAVVPHDITFILDNRMGDCKDQATLLQSLLTAEGIKNTQALVNSGSIYNLPSIPTVSAVNHVINYLPEYNLFIDATSETIPFGLTSVSIQDKPVLLVDGYKEGMRTPANQHVDTQRLTSDIVIDKQGNATGKIRVELDGLIAAYSRKGFRHSTPKQEKDWLKEMFSQDGYKGFGSLTKEDPMPLKDSFEFKVEFNMERYLPLYGLAAFVIGPDLPTQLPIHSVLATPDEANKVDVVCRPVTSEEIYTIELPDNIEIIATPDNTEVSGAGLYYSSKYAVVGKQLKIHRKLEDKTKGNVCSYELMNTQKEVIQKILWDVDSQVVYKVSRT